MFFSICPTNSNAQVQSPVVIDYSCVLDPGGDNNSQLLSGTIEGQCFAPIPMFTDAYQCWFTNQWDVNGGSYALDSLVLLPTYYFSDMSIMDTIDKDICFNRLQLSGNGQDQLLSHSSQIQGAPFAYTQLYLSDCATFLVLDKPLSYNTFLNPIPGQTQNTSVHSTASCVFTYTMNMLAAEGETGGGLE